MQRRQFNQAGISAIGALVLATYQQAHALSLGDLAGISNKDASAGLKTALEKGALAAVALLGKTDGFFGNDRPGGKAKSRAEAGQCRIAADGLPRAGTGAK